MWNIKYIIQDLLQSKNFQEFINHRFSEDSKVILPRNSFKTISTEYATFYFDDYVQTIGDVELDYSFEDMLPSDIVLDIGACIGAFSLKACRKAVRVYAVEPFMTAQLNRNIELNKVKNVIVFNTALGKGELNLKWGNMVRKVKSMSLTEIINLCGGHVDFLKLDCEGGEWYIQPQELQGIRRIEAEVHNFDGKHKFRDFESMLVQAGFDYIRKPLKGGIETICISARKKHN